ncbi:MAG: type sorting protein [Sphingobacteriaceae bacterium]|nr:type sorting protein [Sphingobacteriaceae bacterium]
MLGFILLVSKSVQADTFVSNSGTSLDWNAASTWTTVSSHSIPTSADNVIITSGTTVVITSGTAECADLKLNAPISNSSAIAQITVSSGASLLVYGDVTLGSNGSNADKLVFNGASTFRFGSISGGVVAFDITATIVDVNSVSPVNFPSGFGTTWVSVANPTVSTTTFKTLKINAPVSLSSSLSVTNLIIGDERASAVLDDGSNPIIINAAGSLKMSNAAKYVYRSNTPDPFKFRASDVIDANTTIEISNTGDFSIFIDDNTKFQNLSINGTGVKTIDGNVTRPLSIGGNLTVNSQIVLTTRISSISIAGDYMPSTQLLNPETRPVYMAGDWLDTAVQPIRGTFTYNGSGDQIVGALAYTNLVLTGGGIKKISSPYSATIDPEGIVTVDANTTLDANGKLYLLADAHDNANIAPLANGASITGNVIVQSFFTGGLNSANRSFRSISSPINDNLLSSNKTLEQLKGYMIITGNGGSTNGFDPGGNASPFSTTLKRYNESAPSSDAQHQFLTPSNIYESLEPGKGIFLYFRGDRSNYTPATATTSKKVNSPYLAPEDVLMQYVGPINQGDITIPLSYTENSGPDDATYNGYNLVGNPYPGTIDWTLMDKANTVDQVSVYKPGGGYATYLNGISTNGSNVNLIQAGQGFWVRANASGASITFKESSKSVNSSPARFLSAPTDKLLAGTKGSIPATTSGAPSWKQLRINLQNGINKEEAVVVFNDGSNPNAGFEDATFMEGSSVTLTTRSSDDKDLVINFMPNISQVSELKLNVNATTSGNLTLNFADLSATRNYTTLLKDEFTGNLLDVKANPVYSFTINKSDANTYGPNRFKLLFQPPTNLPVTLLSFSAKKVGIGALITWKTATEQNNDRFELESSQDGRNFKLLSVLKAKGTSNSAASYTYLDKDPTKGTTYYRLKQVDLNGDYVFSNLISVDFERDVAAPVFVLYPNPVVNEVYVDYDSECNDPQSYKLMVYDKDGREMTHSLVEHGQPLKQNVTSLEKGIYILQMVEATTNNIIGKTKFIKN